MISISSCHRAAQEVVSIVKSTLGPRGMDKLIEEGSGTTITNDGATVMKKLNIATLLANSLSSFEHQQDYWNKTDKTDTRDQKQHKNS